MEYLVNMITQVPEGTSDQAVDDMRGQEAARTRELAAQGHVLRLWRPPLAPGQWRTTGLFAADDAAEIERVLASMPLRIWRADEVTQLANHQYDPGPPASGSRGREGGELAAEFLVTFSSAVPYGTEPADIAEATASEVGRLGELASEGHLIRLWALPTEQAPAPALSLWRAGDEAQVQAILKSLPLYPYAKVQVTQLTPHPSDPATQASR